MFPLKDHEPSGIFPLFTILIIIACGIVLGLQMTSGNPETFTYKWSLVPTQINFLEFSTLIAFITSMFLHGGLFHFLSNMWFLWIFGDNVEASLGKLGFMLFYITGGVIAGLVQYFFLIGQNVPILGASGAIAAVLGFYLINFPNSRVETLIAYPFITITELPSKLILSLWFLTQIFNGSVSIVDSAAATGVAWWAHIGGFAFGCIVGIIFKSNKNRYGEIL